MAESDGHALRPPGDYHHPTEESQPQLPDDSSHPESPAKQRPKATPKKHSRNTDNTERGRFVGAEDLFVIFSAYHKYGIIDNVDRSL